MYKFLVSHDIKCDFHIVEVDKKEMRYADDIKYNKWLPYKEVCRRMSRSRCLLEILQKPGEGPTLRMVEAIVYKKKSLQMMRVRRLIRFMTNDSYKLLTLRKISI
jgi:hypothetical protein